MFTNLALQFNRNPQLDDYEGYEQVPSVKCPFDASHIIQPKNLLTHINRCSSPNRHLYVQCKYDPCHWIYPQEKQVHYQECPTRLEHYLEMDMRQGDWDQEQAKDKQQQQARREKKQKRKRKMLKILKYLKKKKLQEKIKKNQNQQNQKYFDSVSQISYKSQNQNSIDSFLKSQLSKPQRNNLVRFLRQKQETQINNNKIKTNLRFIKEYREPLQQNIRTFQNTNYQNRLPYYYQAQMYFEGNIQYLPPNHHPNPYLFNTASYPNYLHSKQCIISPNIPVQSLDQFPLNTYQKESLFYRFQKLEPKVQLMFQTTVNTQQFIKKSIPRKEQQPNQIKQPYSSSQKLSFQGSQNGSNNQNLTNPNNCLNYLYIHAGNQKNTVNSQKSTLLSKDHINNFDKQIRKVRQTLKSISETNSNYEESTTNRQDDSQSRQTINEKDKKSKKSKKYKDFSIRCQSGDKLLSLKNKHKKHKKDQQKDQSIHSNLILSKQSLQIHESSKQNDKIAGYFNHSIQRQDSQNQIQTSYLNASNISVDSNNKDHSDYLQMKEMLQILEKEDDKSKSKVYF